MTSGVRSDGDVASVSTLESGVTVAVTAWVWDHRWMQVDAVTVDLDPSILAQARELGVDVPDAARRGVEAAVGAARTQADRRAYGLVPEKLDPDWEAAEAWGDDSGL